MKTRTLVSILILALAVLIIIGGCATTPEIKEEREGVNQEVFFQSVKNGDYPEVKSLIEEGVDVNTQVKDGFTALMLPTEYGNIEVIKLLIKEGANVKTTDRRGFTPLMTAAQSGHAEVA